MSAYEKLKTLEITFCPMDLETEMVNVNVSTPTGGLSLDVKWGIMKVLTQIIKTIKKSEHKYRRNRINKIH